MKRYELLVAGALFVLSTVMKIYSLVILCTAHAHHEELPHDLSHKIASKKPKTKTHLPIK